MGGLWLVSSEAPQCIQQMPDSSCSSRAGQASIDYSWYGLDGASGDLLCLPGENTNPRGDDNQVWCIWGLMNHQKSFKSWFCCCRKVKLSPIYFRAGTESNREEAGVTGVGCGTAHHGCAGHFGVIAEPPVPTMPVASRNLYFHLLLTVKFAVEESQNIGTQCAGEGKATFPSPHPHVS